MSFGSHGVSPGTIRRIREDLGALFSDPRFARYIEAAAAASARASLGAQSGPRACAGRPWASGWRRGFGSPCRLGRATSLDVEEAAPERRGRARRGPRRGPRRRPSAASAQMRARPRMKRETPCVTAFKAGQARHATLSAEEGLRYAFTIGPADDVDLGGGGLWAPCAASVSPASRMTDAKPATPPAGKPAARPPRGSSSRSRLCGAAPATTAAAPAAAGCAPPAAGATPPAAGTPAKAGTPATAAPAKAKPATKVTTTKPKKALTEKQKKDEAKKLYKEAEARFDKGEFAVAADLYRQADEVRARRRAEVQARPLARQARASSPRPSRPGRRSSIRSRTPRSSRRRSPRAGARRGPEEDAGEGEGRDRPGDAARPQGRGRRRGPDRQGALGPARQAHPHRLRRRVRRREPGARCHLRRGARGQRHADAAGAGAGRCGARAAPTPPPAEAPPAQPPPPAAPIEPRSPVPAYVTLGLAGAGVVVGTIFGIQALGAKSDFDDAPTTKTADKVDRFALIADMSFAVALTFGVTGAVLLLSDDPAQGEGRSVERDEEGVRHSVRQPDRRRRRRAVYLLRGLLCGRNSTFSRWRSALARSRPSAWVASSSPPSIARASRGLGSRRRMF